VTVHVSMIGFDDGTETIKSLDGNVVDKINPDLSFQTNLTQAKSLSENDGICFMGPSAKGPFDIDEALAIIIIRATGNPNGKSNSDVVKRVASAIDLVQEQRNKRTLKNS